MFARSKLALQHQGKSHSPTDVASIARRVLLTTLQTTTLPSTYFWPPIPLNEDINLKNTVMNLTTSLRSRDSTSSDVSPQNNVVNVRRTHTNNELFGQKLNGTMQAPRHIKEHTIMVK